MRVVGSFVFLFLALSPLGAAPQMAHSWPKRGPVPTAGDAIAIAVRLWSPLYGADHIAHEKPYHATLKNGVWTVSGSIPRGAVGGAAILKIRKSDGEVLFLSHYK